MKKRINSTRQMNFKDATEKWKHFINRFIKENEVVISTNATGYYIDFIRQSSFIFKSKIKEVSDTKLNEITDRWTKKPGKEKIPSKWLKNIPKLEEKIPRIKINKKKILSAFELLKSNKTPGLTGLTKEFYCCFKDETYYY